MAFSETTILAYRVATTDDDLSENEKEWTFAQNLAIRDIEKIRREWVSENRKFKIGELAIEHLNRRIIAIRSLIGIAESLKEKT